MTTKTHRTAAAGLPGRSLPAPRWHSAAPPCAPRTDPRRLPTRGAVTAQCQELAELDYLADKLAEEREKKDKAKEAAILATPFMASMIK